MSVTQNSYDNSFNANAGGAAPAPGTNPEFDLKDAQQLDEAEMGEGGQFNILGGQIGNITQQATQVAKQGADAVVNAGKGIMEMGGSMLSGLKRGFSKTSETGGE